MKKTLNVLLVYVEDSLEDVCAHFNGAKVIAHPIESAVAAIAKIDETKFDLVVLSFACTGGSSRVIKHALERDPKARIIGLSYDPTSLEDMKEEGCFRVVHPSLAGKAVLTQLKLLAR